MSSLNLRPATMADARHLMNWRNDPVSVHASLSEKPVEWEDHKRWLNQILEEGCTKIFIAEQQAIPIGMVRFDPLHGLDQPHLKRAEMSWIIAPEARGKGLGRALLEAGLNHYEADLLIALIKKDNLPSRKIAESVGFRFKSDTEDALRFELSRHKDVNVSAQETLS